MNKKNLIFTAAVLLIAAGLFAALQLVFARAGGGPAAVLEYGEPVQTMVIDLHEDAQYDVDTGFYTIHLRVEDGSIAFVDSPCPDHLCEGFGRLKSAGDWAACLPAYASLSVVDAEDLP